MEYRTQTILGTLQVIAILAGTVMVGVAMRVTDDALVSDPAVHELWAFPRRVTDWGFCLIPLPILWVILTIRNERAEHESKSSTLVSGLALLIGLLLLFGLAARKALVIFP
jgi:hypothetical protein